VVHPKLNLAQRSSDLKYYSTKTVWWHCAKSEKHAAWEATVYSVVKAHKTVPLAPGCKHNQLAEDSSNLAAAIVPPLNDCSPG
jgi:hypothetical protein